MGYQVVSAEDSHQLSRSVEARMQYGWRPLGGVTVTDTNRGRVFIQAMVHDFAITTAPTDQGASCPR